MSDTAKDRPNLDLNQPGKLTERVLDQLIGMLGAGSDARSKLVTLEDFLRHGELTPAMTERWARAKAGVQKLAADKQLNDRARKRARLVLARMETLSTPSS